MARFRSDLPNSGTLLSSRVQEKAQASRMIFGAPFTKTANFAPAGTLMPPSPSFAACASPPSSFTTVSIIFRLLLKGISKTRGNAWSVSLPQKPTFAAATTSGASELLPLGTHCFDSGSWDSVVLLQSNPARRVLRTVGSDFPLSDFSSPGVAEGSTNCLLFKASAPAASGFSLAVCPKPPTLSPEMECGISMGSSAGYTLPTFGSKPAPDTSYSLSADHIFTSVIFPSVSVPVLSVQITEALPSVSTAASRVTSTCRCTIVLAPEEREIVTQSGMPSGMAATASVTATRIMYSHDSFSGSVSSLVPMAQPTRKTPTHTAMAMYPM
mmetsp:Transcript_18439/g.46055  ORF Transcript_18439/g.46055 Transcript_18439/m.46055 type:complete len:326 (-) Transcript_18439:1369-2346(-)